MKILEACHSDGLGGGHFGRDKTFFKVSERFYWVGILENVKQFCRTCERCQKANRYVYNIKYNGLFNSLCCWKYMCNYNLYNL